MELDEAIKSIKSVKIQGAENVAVFSLNVFKSEFNKLKDENLINDSKIIKKKLIQARPTEPCLRNSLNYLFDNLHGGNLKEQINEKIDFMLDFFKNSKKSIAEIGANKIKSGMVVYTHCHSSTVIDIIKKAKKQGKKFEVYNTETRPLLQGKTTAKELAEEGININYFIDSGMRMAIKESDIVLLGADSISCEAKVINKIGSELAAEVAKNFDVPLYICTNSWKYNPQTTFGFDEEIEKRNKEEIWKNAPKNVNIINYAFEIIKPELISGIISEIGIYTPYIFIDEITRTYPEIFNKKLNNL